MSSTMSGLKLFWKIVTGIVLFTIANVVVYFNSGYFSEAREYRATVEDAGTRPTKVVNLGDSHAAQLLNEFLDDSVYNAASGGDGPRESYAKLRYLLDRYETIDTVLLSADAHMFGRARQDSANRAFVDWYLLATGSPYGLDRGRLAMLMNAIPLFSDEFVQYLKAVATEMLRSAGANEEDDKEKDKIAWHELTESERAAAARTTGLGDHAGVGMHPESLEWYARTHALAEMHHVKILLIRYPAHPEYLRTIPEEGLRSVDADLARLGLAPILDFSTVFSDPAYFDDPDHVSPTGARALIKLLEERIGLPLQRPGNRE